MCGPVWSGPVWSGLVPLFIVGAWDLHHHHCCASCDAIRWSVRVGTVLRVCMCARDRF